MAAPEGGGGGLSDAEFAALLGILEEGGRQGMSARAEPINLEVLTPPSLTLGGSLAPEQAQLLTPPQIAQMAAASSRERLTPQLAAAAPPQVAIDPRAGIDAPQLGIAAPPPIAANATDFARAQLGAEQAVAQPAFDPRRIGASAQGGLTKPVPPSATPTPPPGGAQSTVEELRQQIANTRSQLENLQLQRLNRSAAEVRQGNVANIPRPEPRRGAGAIFPPGATAGEKAFVLGDLALKLGGVTTGKTLAQEAIETNRALAQQGQPQLTAAQGRALAASLEHVNQVQGKIVATKNPQMKEAIANLESERIASFLGMPSDDPIVETLKDMMLEPKFIPNIDQILTDPRFAGMKQMIMNADWPALVDAIQEGLKDDGIITRINDDDNIRAGLPTEAASNKKALEDLSGETITSYDQWLELQSLLPDIAPPGEVAAMGPNKAGTVRRRLQEQLGFMTREEIELRRKKAIERESALEEKRAKAEIDQKIAAETPGLPGKAAREEAVQLGAIGTADLLSMADLMSASDDIIEGATGVSGIIVENIIGPIGQLNASFGNSLSRVVADASLDEVANFRAKAQAIIARTVPVATREEGSRITKEELDITARTTRLSDAMSSLPQIKAAMSALTQLNVLRVDRHRAEAGQPRRFELSTAEGLSGMANRLESLGMNAREINETLDSLERQRDELSVLGLK